MCELRQMVLLAVLACHPVLPVVDGDAHLPHGTCIPVSASVQPLGRLDDHANRRDHLVEPLRDLASRRLEPTPASDSRIELGGEPCAIGIEGMNLRGERGMALVVLEPPLDRAFERLERGLQTLGRRLDRADLVHAPPRRSAQPAGDSKIAGVARCYKQNFTWPAGRPSTPGTRFSTAA